MKFILASASEIKRKALARAINRSSEITQASIASLETSSVVNEQPFGLDETYRGAMHRARQAHEFYPDAVAIGIENGIERFDDEHYVDLAVCVLMHGDDVFIATSAGVEFPKEDVKEAQQQGFFATTVGSVIAERLKCNHADPHSALTGGSVSREDMLAEALYILICRAGLSDQ